MSEEERVILTAEQAIAMLPDGDNAHTFLGNGFLVGADWKKQDVVDALKRSIRIELSGPLATSMGHKICFWDGPRDNGRWYFVETKETVKA